MVDEDREASSRNLWGPRLLAPLAFFLAATVLVLLIHNALSAGDGETKATTGLQRSARAATTTRTRSGTGTTAAAAKRFYRVRPGDTLESIAARFNTDVEKLLELNPNIDPLSLSVGQRLRVR